MAIDKMPKGDRCTNAVCGAPADVAVDLAVCDLEDGRPPCSAAVDAAR